MHDILLSKEQAVADTPLLLFDCVFADGSLEHLSTHEVTIGGQTYSARILKQNVFEMQIGSDLGVDAIPKIAVELANADSRFSEIERSVGFKNALLTVSLVFYDFPNAVSTSPRLLFKGLLNPPEEVTEETFRVSAINRLSLQRVVLPPVRIQKRCHWDFPTNAAERKEASYGGSREAYSRLYGCGYSPDVEGGVGNLGPDGAPFTSCAYTRADCSARGMFSTDEKERTTARFGGIEFVPPTITVRSAGEKGSHTSPVEDNQGRYNDFVPLIYGTVWLSPSVVFSRNDGNLTHFEVLLGMGEIQGIQKVLVSQIEIPIGQAGRNMTGTGWYNLISAGTRNGAFNNDFSDKNHNAMGDPYGGKAFLSIVVPNRINDGSSLPGVQVLLDGLKLPQYASDGTAVATGFSNNPAWVVLDLLRRIGWSLSELDLLTFVATAGYCAEPLQTTDLFGNPVITPRFQCNLVVKRRHSAADVIRGVRNGARLFLRYGTNGLLQLVVENSFALQQPNPIPGSNAQASFNGGWPAYEFGDGTNGTTGIARLGNGASSVRISSRSTSDTPNRFVAEFQDAFNEYQQDSFSVVDPDDLRASGQEITSTTQVLGLPHYDQAARILAFYLSKSVYGNTFIEFSTSIKALGLNPGDLFTITYAKEGFYRQPFRVIKIQPGTNYRTVKVAGQVHRDEWYYDTNGQTTANSGRRQSAIGVGLPRPLGGTEPDGNGSLAFGITENFHQMPDGTAALTATVEFSAPLPSQLGAPDIPLISLSSKVLSSGGTLSANQHLYYAISSLGADGSESALSFIVNAFVLEGTNTNSVVLSGLSFSPPTASFQVYRGETPVNLQRIASAQPLAGTFTDSGLTATAQLPPDANYDHSDFYWRLELQPPVNATIVSTSTIGSDVLELIEHNYTGMVARIISGTGAGQEATVLDNSSNLLTIAGQWSILPDSTSIFVVAQGSYQFGGTSRTSPVQFAIPDQAGNVIHVSGRSANCNGAESPYEVSPLTRYLIGGSGLRNADSGPAPAPVFGIAPNDSGGGLRFGAVAFPDLSNVSTVASGTFKLYFIDEIAPPQACALAASIGVQDQTVRLNTPFAASNLSFAYIDSEIVQIVQSNETGTLCNVKRAQHGTVAIPHTLGSQLLPLSEQVTIVPFARNFFGSPASGDWSYSVDLPNVRVVSAGLFVTNSQGDSPISAINFLTLTDKGIRTLSGAQLGFRIDGFLSAQAGAAPDLVVDAPHVLRDAYAVVKQCPVGGPIAINVNLNGSPYFSLSISDSSYASSSVNGALLPPMRYKDLLSVDLVQVGLTSPGSDLTIILRL